MTTASTANRARVNGPRQRPRRTVGPGEALAQATLQVTQLLARGPRRLPRAFRRAVPGGSRSLREPCSHRRRAVRRPCRRARGRSPLLPREHVDRAGTPPALARTRRRRDADHASGSAPSVVPASGGRSPQPPPRRAETGRTAGWCCPLRLGRHWAADDERRSPAERGFRRRGSCGDNSSSGASPNTSPPLTIPARSFAAPAALKPATWSCMVPLRRPRPGVGSNGSQPYPRNQTSTYVWAS